MYQQLFNIWFAQNYEQLKTQLCCGGTFGELYEPNCEDCLHNAYLCVFDSLKRFEGVTDFQTLFVAAYRRQRKAYQVQDVKEILPSDLFWAFLVESENDPEDSEQRNIYLEERAKAVKAFAKKHFNQEQQQVFKMFFVYSCTLGQIAAYVGKSIPTITKYVKWCKNCLQCEFKEFCLFANN